MGESLRREKRFGFDFWILFIAIYCSHDTILFGTNIESGFISVRKIIPICITGVMLLKMFYSNINTKQLVITMAFVALPLVSCVVHGEPIYNYIYRAFIMLSAALFVIQDSKKRFYYYFSDIMYFLCIWSVITFVLGNIVPNALNDFPVVTNIAGRRMTNIFFSLVSKSHTYDLSRNASLFREPGVYVVFLIYAIVVELIAIDKTRPKYLAVYIITLATTLSTAGYIMLAAVVVYLILFSNAKHKYLYTAAVIGFVTVLVTQTNLLTADGAMFNKFQVGGNSYGSWFARLSSVTKNVEIFIKNPVFGIGRYTLYDTVLNKMDIYAARDNTNTMLINFSAYGVFFGTASIIGLWKFCRKNTLKIRHAIFFFVLLFTAMSNEDMGQNIVYYIILFEGFFGEYKVPRKELDKEQIVQPVGIYKPEVQF